MRWVSCSGRYTSCNNTVTTASATPTLTITSGQGDPKSPFLDTAISKSARTTARAPIYVTQKNEGTEAWKALRRVLTQVSRGDLIWPGSDGPAILIQGKEYNSVEVHKNPDHEMGKEKILPVLAKIRINRRFLWRKTLKIIRTTRFIRFWRRFGLTEVYCITFVTIHTEGTCILTLTCTNIRMLLAHWMIWNLKLAHSQQKVAGPCITCYNYFSLVADNCISIVQQRRYHFYQHL